MTAPEEDLATPAADDLAAPAETDRAAADEPRRTTSDEIHLTPPDESRLDESQQLIDEAKKIAHDLREEVPDTTPEPPREEGSPAN
ncbi:hypothetical protein [Lentzea sp. NPDC059081]|uniref:hypothetical protein n=1 Tax=Lentzea sp. NPDC059081 TaxID=3346719 RepID=UPI0036A832C1